MWKLTIHIFIVDRRSTSLQECGAYYGPTEYPALESCFIGTHAVTSVRKFCWFLFCYVDVNIAKKKRMRPNCTFMCINTWNSIGALWKLDSDNISIDFNISLNILVVIGCDII